MAVSREFALQQLKRFASFPGAPQTEGELLDRAEYLAQLSGTNEQCRIFCDRMLKFVDRFPLPAHMHQAEEMYQLPEWRGNAAPKCARCKDTGLISFQRDGLDFSEFCPDCRPRSKPASRETPKAVAINRKKSTR